MILPGKPLNLTRTESELEIITKAVKSDKRPEVRQRAMGLRLLHEGHPVKEVAKLMSVSQPTVYDWPHRWQENGLNGLTNRPKHDLITLQASEARKSAQEWLDELKKTPK